MKRIVRLRGKRNLLSCVVASAVASGGLAFAGVAVGAEEQATAEAAAEAAAVDLRLGGVYSMSNSEAGNEVVAYGRTPNGRLVRVGSFPTGGRGSGGFEDSDNGLVLGSAQGESSPNNLDGGNELLFATNSGSDSISVFRVGRDRLELVELQYSRGVKPVSITVNRGRVYVLNSGETERNLVVPNCAVTSREHLPQVTGFTVDERGKLAPIPGSARTLSGDRNSGCSQVSFNPSGKVLVVTERLAKLPGQGPDDEGAINTFVVDEDGTLGQHRVVDATGQGPFGFTFNKQGALLTTEQFDGPEGPGQGAAAGYLLGDDGTLTPTSASVHNGGTDTCWFVLTNDGRYGYTSSFFGTGRISSYVVAPDGGLQLLDGRAAGPEVQQGAADLALSRDSRYLYLLNAFRGTISSFRIGENGGLALVQTVQAHAPSPKMAARLGLAAS